MAISSSPLLERSGRRGHPMEFHVSLVGRKDLSGEIYRQMRRAILDGRLRPGDFLPPSRGLARSLNVSRTTVAVAYDRLAGEGYVASRIGSGTWVTDHVAPPAREVKRHQTHGVLRPRAVWNSVPVITAFARAARFDFRTGLPDASLFPHRTWRRLTARQLRADSAGKGMYAHPSGHRG